MMKTYAKLTENNEWEGETWRFWIPIEGNVGALRKLEKALGDSDEYELDRAPVPEAEVDVLVKHTGCGYMAYDNKLAGTLTLTDEVIAQIEVADGDARPLYKGGIKDLMVVTA